MVKKEEPGPKSNIAYYITIDMELHPGTSLTPEELKHVKCRQKWNAVRRSYADFTGKTFVIPPVYQSEKKDVKTIENKGQNLNTKNRFNKTRRQQNNPNIYNRRKTRINRPY
jgi:hypothetical protein